MSTVLIIADDLDYAFAVQRNLECEGIHTLVARDEFEGHGLATPQVVILDWRGGDFHDLLTTVVQKNPRAWIHVTTPIADPVHRAELLDLGADDVLTKPFNVVELVSRVRVAIRRSALFADPEAVVLGRAEVSFRERTVCVAGRIIQLPPKGFELLEALWAHRGEAVSRVTLLKDVWHHRAVVATRTVDQHVCKLRRVLEWDATRPAVIVTVPRIGYRMDVHQYLP